MAINATSETNRIVATLAGEQAAIAQAGKAAAKQTPSMQSAEVVGDSGIAPREPIVTVDVMASINRSGKLVGDFESLTSTQIVERAANWVVDGKLNGFSRFFRRSLTSELASQMKKDQDAAWKKVNDAAIAGFMAAGLAGFILGGLAADAAPPKYSRKELKERARFELLTAARGLVAGNETPHRFVSAKAYELVRREIAEHKVQPWETFAGS